jgi:[lysine-biosynthesis-protein LysW]--L-2-aminoadipate ligase
MTFPAPTVTVASEAPASKEPDQMAQKRVHGVVGDHLQLRRPGRVVRRGHRRPDTTAGVRVLGCETNETSGELVRQWRRLGLRAELLSPLDAREVLRPGHTVLARLDVLPTLDGVEPGLLELLWLERRGIRVLNRAATLLAVHDKLRTSHLLRAAGLPHPRTAVLRGDERPSLEPPLVLKPRFGSWGRDVMRCRDRAELDDALAVARDRPWFRRHGALLQELLPPLGHDLRLLVAGGEVVGAGERIAARGEWRTNVSLGGSARPSDPPPRAQALACAAAKAVGGDLVGVDLLPLDGNDYVVLELNGAVDFDERYALGGDVDLYLQIARALGLAEERSTP